MPSCFGYHGACHDRVIKIFVAFSVWIFFKICCMRQKWEKSASLGVPPRIVERHLFFCWIGPVSKLDTLVLDEILLRRKGLESKRLFEISFWIYLYFAHLFENKWLQFPFIGICYWPWLMIFFHIERSW